MKIGIVGSGAIGLYYGVRLQRSGQDVRFLMRSDLERARSTGISVRAPDGDFTLCPVEASNASDAIGICDLLAVSIKTTGNEDLPEILRPMVGPETVLLTLQNGLGNDGLLAELFPNNRILGGLCFVCLNRVAPATVENYMLGSVLFAPRRPEDLELAEQTALIFRTAGVEARVEADLRLAQWKKLVWNVPFNGLAIAAGGVATDVIMSSEALVAEARGLMEEVLAAAAAKGMTISPSFIDHQIERTRHMGAYRPSSMIDFVAGRPVEVEGIWGEPLRQARAAGAAMPKLEMLYALLKQLCRTG